MAVLTLTELSTLAQSILDANHISPATGRAASRLSPRTIRWYTASGLVDAPLRRDRQAVYSKHHLLQVLYTRKAQSDGRPLDSLRELTHAPTRNLLRKLPLDLSLIPSDLEDLPSAPLTPFWQASPQASPLASPGLSATSPRPTLVHPNHALSTILTMGPVSVNLPANPSPDIIKVLEDLARPLVDYLTNHPSAPPTNPPKDPQ